MFQEEQFTRIAQQYMDTIFRVAFNYLKSPSEADDITQEVLIKLYQADKSFESDDHLRHWLIRVTINCCKKSLLAPWRKVESLENYIQSLSFQTSEHSELFYLTMSLPRKYRLAIYLYYYEDYSTEEIAKILGIPKATVATHLHRGRQLLKTKLQEANNHV